ncbi:hypothetical protein GTGU_02142 [Trabulsiella guamensis ATCC 49490]|uniref:Glycosyltransferase n=1 Tax=Trabulsiella guamensis ATCC 49490 TaxID=1005994 RepID=A0A085AA58_9ENTR|nr:hypothetical protein [Trabulsiella guamensis]KFC07103.1 hypothetical protein GTGU_02142 [Trabulsiella guamensis ATCC 49490]
MNEFTVILSKCHFSSVGLTHILSYQCGNANIVSFCEVEDFYEWRKMVSKEVLLKLYIVIPPDFGNLHSLGCIISSIDLLEKTGVNEVVILNESALLPQLFSSIGSFYGWRIINIHKMTCKEILYEISHVNRKKKTAMVVVLF